MEYEQALLKLQKYCVYQDRCHQEVRKKLIDIKIYGDELENIITDLIRDNFLNEERFAKSFCRGKFRMKKWGRNKILAALKFKQVSAYCIKKGLLEIDEEEYRDVLGTILEVQLEKHSELGSVLAKDKALKYAVSRGYEPKLIFEILGNRP